MAEAKSKRAERREEKRKNRGPGMFAQMKQVFEMTKKSDPNIGWIMVLAALATILLFLLVGLLLNNWITFLIIGIPFGILVAVMILSRRAEKAAFAQIEGQPGAAGAALSTLRRGWIVEQQPVAMNPRTQDLIFRVLGRPGVILVTEGPSQRVGTLISQEKKRLKRVIPTVPVHVVNAGNDEGQVPLKKLSKELKKLDKTLTAQEVASVNSRLASLGNMQLPVPKGVDPMRARPDRKAMRGR